MGRYVLPLGNGQAATIEYTFGGSVEEDNHYHLDANTFVQQNSFRCASTLTVTLSTDLPEPLTFGFVANVIRSERIGYYASSRRTKVTYAMPIQCLDGDGQERPFAVTPTDGPEHAGTQQLTIRYEDDPPCQFARKDEEASNEGNTLVRVDGDRKSVV